MVYLTGDRSWDLGAQSEALLQYSQLLKCLINKYYIFENHGLYYSIESQTTELYFKNYVWENRAPKLEAKFREAGCVEKKEAASRKSDVKRSNWMVEVLAFGESCAFQYSVL